MSAPQRRNLAATQPADASTFDGNMVLSKRHDEKRGSIVLSNDGRNGSRTLTLVSWNMNGLATAWDQVIADASVDVALVQEARPPTTSIPLTIVSAASDWSTGGAPNRSFCTAVAARKGVGRPTVTAIPTHRVGDPEGDGLAVSIPGTIALGEVRWGAGQAIVVASVYSCWDSPVGGGGWIYADSSAHRLISDLSGLIDSQRSHRIIVAGDWNILYGYGEQGSSYWARRYQTVFDRMEALGLTFCGPQHPNGLPAAPPPAELPETSRNVPTYRRNRNDPSTGTRQLDFAFASAALAPKVSVCADNGADGWAPSDHCRVIITVEP